MQLFKRPNNRFHIGNIHGFVVVFEVDPSPCFLNVILPLRCILHYTFFALLVKLFNTVLSNSIPPLNSKLLFNFHFCWQTVAIPPEATRRFLALHSLIACVDIFYEGCQQMTIVWQAVCKWGAIVEDELSIVYVFNGFLKNFVFLPKLCNFLFKLWKVIVFK